jgi:Tol biopolymer transport system component
VALLWRRTACALLVAEVMACGGGDSGTGPPPPPPPPAAVATVTVTPARDTVVLGDVVAVNVVARDSAGTVLTGRTTIWSYSDSTLVTRLAGGSLRAEKIGSLQVIATVEGKSDTATLALVPVVVVGRRFPSLFNGDTTAVTARLEDIFGDSVPGPAPVWSTVNPAIATVSAQGVLAAHQLGATYVRAAVAGGRDSQLVTVLAPVFGVNREVTFLHDSSTPAYSSAKELWRAAPDGSNPVRLTGDGFDVEYYRWSPDGSRIVLVGGQVVGTSGVLDLFMLSGEGDTLTPLGTLALLPEWSPDGLRLVFYDAVTSDLGIMNRDGSGRHVLNTGNGVNSDSRWSPDGHQIAWRKDTGLLNEIWLGDQDGTHQRKLPLPPGLSPRWVEWAPDGKDLALITTGVWLIHADGTGLRPLSPECSLPSTCTGVTVEAVSWAPDGQRLAYGTLASTVVVIGRDGNGYLSIPIVSSGEQTLAYWSPDGQRILFNSANPADTMSTQPQRSYSTMAPDGQNVVVGALQMRVGAVGWRP